METLIETERLILRKVIPDDAEDIFLLHSDPEVQKYTGEAAVRTIAEVKEGMKTHNFKDYETYGFGRLAAVLKQTDQFIGWAGLKYLPQFDQVDLGYRLKQEFWGKGYATEASLAIIEYGFNTLELERIIAISMPENIASIRVMEKIGMKYYKHAPYEEGEDDALWYEIKKTALYLSKKQKRHEHS